MHYSVQRRIIGSDFSGESHPSLLGQDGVGREKLCSTWITVCELFFPSRVFVSEIGLVQSLSGRIPLTFYYQFN